MSVVFKDANSANLLSGATLDSATTSQGTAVEILWPQIVDGVQFYLDVGSVTGTSPTLDVTIEGCETSDFSTDPVVSYGTIQADGTDDGVYALVAHVDSKYVRANVTTGGTSPDFSNAVLTAELPQFHRKRGAHPTSAPLA